ncbi:hypothetical protein HELRODRAFT_70817 [Helobdella robusta]|uniref:Uncharacterized protein n=1 Tax=Helobdella robusta TaxID=6412 RepID=T1G0C7_HELRO|nr:hypothetical protein HELRODRAFT_70817 [Helobdella robusta]ESN90311.1 hypothetical protein HELRODRAFT_70817 [Helobdella robusta]
MPPQSASKDSRKTASKAKATRSMDKKHKRRQKKNYFIYIKKVLNQVHPGTGTRGKSMLIMLSFVNDIFE